jgi:FeS assembly protein IscX
VAQNGGFATEVGSYTWLWAEFNMEGNFARDPYWVEGTWKEALTALLVPLDRQASYLLAGRAETPDALLLQEGARPNDQNYTALMPGIAPANESTEHEPEHKHVDIVVETSPAPPVEIPEEKPAEAVIEQNPIPPAPPVEEAKPAETPPAAPPPLSASEVTAEKSEESASPRIDTPAPFAIRWGMSFKLTWKDADDIAYALIDAHPDQDPLKLSFPKLHKLVIELPDFADDPDKSSESILESIQMAWYEEVK